MSLIIASRVENVGLIKLNRLSASNALSSSLIEQVLSTLKVFDDDHEIGAIVLTGSDDVFCGESSSMTTQNFGTEVKDHVDDGLAGADIKELKNLTFVRAYMDRFLQNLNDVIANIRKPILAVVNGYAVSVPKEIRVIE